MGCESHWMVRASTPQLPHRAVGQGQSVGSVGTTSQGNGRVSREGRMGQAGTRRAQGGERPMGAAAYGGKGSKERARVSGERPRKGTTTRRNVTQGVGRGWPGPQTTPPPPPGSLCNSLNRTQPRENGGKRRKIGLWPFCIAPPAPRLRTWASGPICAASCRQQYNQVSCQTPQPSLLRQQCANPRASLPYPFANCWHTSCNYGLREGCA